MDMKDFILFAVGAFAGYYFVSHMRKTGAVA
jgi:hypothetical protein